MPRFALNLETKFVLLAALLVIIVAALLTYYLSHMKLEDEVNNATRRAQLISQSTAASVTNTLLYEEIGLIEEAGLLDNQISDLMMNDDAAIIEIVVLDAQGGAISTSNYFWYQSKFNFGHLRLSGIPLEMRTLQLTRDGLHQLEIVSPLRIHNKTFGVMCIYYSLEEEYTKFAIWQTKLFIAAFIFFMGNIIVAFMVARILAKPIKHLAGEMVKVEDTSYTPVIETIRTDEIGYLERGFLDMMHRLNKAAIEKQHSQNALLRAEKMATIGTLTAGLAHEINNPIGGMKTCLQRISRAPENVDQIVEYSGLMEKALNQIERLVQSLLNYSRARDPIFHEVNLNTIIESVVEFTNLQSNKNLIATNTTLDPTLPLILGDGRQLEQVILNLVLNAIDAIDETGEVRITSTYDDTMIRVSIYDNGSGIPPDVLELIFEPFYTTKEKGKGTGLGLAVCHNILLSHEAKISVTSKIDSGTTILLEFDRSGRPASLESEFLSAAILVGGKSSRMGSNKALKKLNGQTMVEWVLEGVQKYVKEPLLITNEKQEYLFLNLPIYEDIIPGLGPLGGIYTALKNINSSHCLILACDLPFISGRLIERIIQESISYDLTVVDGGNGYEPLCAVYSKALIPAIEQQIKSKRYGLHQLIDKVDAHIIKFNYLNNEGAMNSFHNINTPNDFSRAQQLLNKG